MSASPRQESTRVTWRAAGLCAGILLLLILLLYRETTVYLIDLWNQWKTGEYGHGYLVLALSLYLVYSKRRILAERSPCPAFGALVAVAASSFLWLLAVLTDTQMLQAIALLLAILSAIWVVLGTRAARQLLLPVCYLAFALPVWSPLLPLLQEMTTDVVFWMTRMSGIPALRQEHLIVLPAGRLSIDTACSGLRFLLAALTLGVFYAYLNYRKTRSRVLVVMVCASAAIVLNFLRVYIVVYLAYVTEMQHPLVRDHLALGWFLFGGLVFILLAIDFTCSRSGSGAGTEGSSGARPVAGAVCHYGYTRLGMALIAVLVVLGAAPATARWTQGAIAAAQPVLPVLPAGAGGWSGPAAADDRWRPAYHGALAEQRSYRKDGREVSVYIGYYPVQSQGSEVINDLNRIDGTGYWREVYSRGRPTRVGERVVLEQVLERRDQQRLVWYWYRIAGGHTVNRYEAKWLQALGLLRGDLQASVVALAVDPRGNMAEARKVLGEFMGAMEHALVRAAAGNPPG